MRLAELPLGALEPVRGVDNLPEMLILAPERFEALPVLGSFRIR